MGPGFLKDAFVIVLTLLVAAGFVRGNDELVFCVGTNGHAAVELAHAGKCQTSCAFPEKKHHEEPRIDATAGGSHHCCVDFPFAPGAFASGHTSTGTAKHIAYDLSCVHSRYDREYPLEARPSAWGSPPRADSIPLLRSVVLLT